jgi:hypothetical protein
MVYAAIVACALVLRLHLPALREFDTWAAHALLILCTFAAGAAVWYLLLQLLVLRRFCFYCVLAHLGALTAAALLALIVAPEITRWDDPPALAAIGSLGAVLVLILLQLLIRPRLHRIAPPEEVMPEAVELDAPTAEPEEVEMDEQTVEVEEPGPDWSPDGAVIPEPPPPPPPPPAAEVEVPPPPQVRPAPVIRPPRQITLLGGRLHFDSAVFPILGPPDAKFLIATMMDYTCEFCRRLHPMLDEAIAAFNGQLATLMVFAPLEPACNPLVEEFEPKHINACAYARLALAVATIDESQFVPFHRWLFEGEQPPTIDQAEARAAEWIGEQALRDAITGERVKQRLNDGLTLYKITGKGPLPRVLLPTGVLMGEVSDTNYLVTLLRGELSKPPVMVGADGKPQQQAQQQQRPAPRASPFSNRLIE